jgi:hypothetical protein
MDSLSLFYPERRRKITVTLCWGAILASILASALFQRSVLSPLDTTFMFAVGVFATALIGDIEYGLLGYFAAFFLGLSIFFLAATLPILLGTQDFSLLDLWIAIIFRAVFPFPFIIALLGSIIGSAVGEKYL